MTGVWSHAGALIRRFLFCWELSQQRVEAGEFSHENDCTPYGLRVALAKYRKGPPAEHDTV
jgi:hypothetical protein